MSEFRTYGEMDDPIVRDGDRSFVGINSYLEPETLSEGYVQDAQDMRMDGERAKVRKGWDFQAGLTGISPSYNYNAGTDQVWGTGVYSDPDDGNKDWIVNATRRKAILWNESEQLYVNYYTVGIDHPDVSTASDTFTKSGGHSLQTGSAVQVTTDLTLPFPLAINTTYYVIKVSGTVFKLAASYADAIAGTQIDITTQGNGEHTFRETVDSTANPTIVQGFNQVFILRYKARPLVWDGTITATGDVVDSQFVSLSNTATLQTGGAGTGDAFPSTDYGIYFRDRLWGIQPPDVVTPTQAVTGAQTVIGSDLLEPNNVTPTESEFYMNQGSADWTVGFSTYQENSLVVFNRRSIRMLTNVHATSISENYPITTRYGCAARRTIAQGGGYIFFLSDEGVMTLSAAQDSVTGMGLTVSKLQGGTEPLSKSIQEQVNNIDYTESVVKSACGVIHDNKYYLAVRLTTDSSNTTVFVYDIINQAWVSKDTYPSGIENFQKIIYNQKIRLFATLPTGWYLMEENAGLDDTNRTVGSDSETDTAAITAKLKTRNYTFGTNAVKHFQRVKLGVNVVSGDAFTVKCNSTDPDITKTVGSYTATGTEDLALNYGSRQRGYSCNIEVDVTAGSPEFRYVSLSGTQQEQLGRREVS